MIKLKVKAKNMLLELYRYWFGGKSNIKTYCDCIHVETESSGTVSLNDCSVSCDTSEKCSIVLLHTFVFDISRIQETSDIFSKLPALHLFIIKT